MARRPQSRSSRPPGSSRAPKKATPSTRFGRFRASLTNPVAGSRKTSAVSAARRRAAAGERPTTPRASSRPSPRTQRSIRDRISEERHLVYEGKERTHRISLRLAAIVVFALVGILIVANPLTQYLAQQEQIRQAQANLDDARGRVAALEQELELWQDPLYVQAQARERLGYVMPGQTLYAVSDPETGDSAQQLQARTDEVNRLRRESTPFFVTMWDSVVVAGQVGVLENPQETPIIEGPIVEEESTDAPTTDESATTDAPTTGETEPSTDNTTGE